MANSFVAALENAPSWILEYLQQDSSRFLLCLYDSSGQRYINSLIGQDEFFPVNEKKNLELTWRLLRYVGFGVPTQCCNCEAYKESGYTFHQMNSLHFLCIGCIQGN